MPGPHRKMVTQEESATVSEGEGEGVARESGPAETGGRVDGDVLGAYRVAFVGLLHTFIEWLVFTELNDD